MSSRENALKNFVGWCEQNITGDEKGEAQIFLDRLYKAFGHAGAREAGGTYEERIKQKRNNRTTTSFADFVVPGSVLIEMKKRGEDLSVHYAQAFDYWIRLVPHRPKYVILCNFDEFWIYELNYQIDEPRDKVKLADLPSRWGPLAFLSPIPQAPTFSTDLVGVTQEAALSLSTLLNRLLDRNIPREDAQHFVLQCMLALFAEDIDLLPRYTFTNIVEDCIQHKKSTFDALTPLFEAMNRKGGTPAGQFREVEYFNGGIFAKIVPIHLTENELDNLLQATKHNWAEVRPAIFGTIFEGSMDKKERHQAGAHYTSEVDIQRIIQPVIVRPWRERIDAATSADELLKLQAELADYQVLDPACGSGNFLYVAYREMKRLEKQILDRVATLQKTPSATSGLVSSRQFWGFDIKPFAVELAKVTLMIAKKLAVDELGLYEKPLPLDNLDTNIRAADALFENWPSFDACVGNPPYLGARNMKQDLDASYVEQVRAAFPGVSGEADYCVYWFRKAHERMKLGARAGLVGTNTIRQNNSREGGLDYIVDNNGHIFEAISSMVWTGEAAVSVSIVCWTKGDPPPSPYLLWINEAQQFTEQTTINSALSLNIDVRSAHELSINNEPKKVFQGQTPGENGFVITQNKAAQFVRKDGRNAQVVFPFMIGLDLLNKPQSMPSRFIIDLNRCDDVIEAQQFKDPFKHIKTSVLPEREAKAQNEHTKNEAAKAKSPRAKLNRDHEIALKTWWKHFRGRPEMITEIEKLSRYIVCSRVTRRPVFDFVSPKIRPGDALQVFAFEDDYSFGILQSDLHWKWFVEKCSTLRSDFRYTSEKIFDTFAWPQQPTPTQVKAVADAARALYTYRRERMVRDERTTLRQLYRTLELPGANKLRDLHDALDKVVIAAYGFDAKSDQLTQLLALNETVYTRIQTGESVSPPGVPSSYPTPADLISKGCVEPQELI